MHFHKVEGLGNDFLLVDRRSEPRAVVEADLAGLTERAPSLCDRRRGVGADGLLIVGAAVDGAHATMWVINADGSRPEMCGNGLRCVAHFVAQSEARPTLTIATDAGLKQCRVEGLAGRLASVEVDMGPGRDEGRPRLEAATAFEFRSVSMGNPHAIAFVDAAPERLARAHGPAIEVDRAFPARTNVEFARMHAGSPPRIELWVWERGVGITEACGTGACATACAAVWSGLAAPDVPIEVELPGGSLEIVVPSERTRGVRMTGPSRIVFEGTIDDLER